MPQGEPSRFSKKKTGFNQMTADVSMIAIIGRPNVGKSTLFNKLARKNKAIVAKESGVTRDYQIESVYWRDCSFKIVDTSGFELEKSELRQSISKQYERLLNRSDGFLFVCDGQSEITELDYELLQKVRKQNKPILPIVNKIDTNHFRQSEGEFYRFFGGRFEKIAAERGVGLNHLLKRCEETFTLTQENKLPESQTIRAAIMGRPNVGKSTLMNQLLSEERVIVSPTPGTTRDSVDSMIKINGQNFLFIDTAGLRKKKKIEQTVEILSVKKAIESLERADIALLVIDGTEGFSDQDLKITDLAWKRGVAIILLINKWDLLPLEKRSNTFWERLLAQKFSAFHKLPVLFISAKESRNIPKIYELLTAVKSSYEKVIDREELKEQFSQWVLKKGVSIKKGRRRKFVKFFDIVQKDHAPPVFEVKATEADIPVEYDRYLKNRLREAYSLWGIPIRFVYKKV
ncbi:MAG: ribosome biogenesis GTPase Der [Deltaproteobacteria bacterium]